MSPLRTNDAPSSSPRERHVSILHAIPFPFDFLPFIWAILVTGKKNPKETCRSAGGICTEKENCDEEMVVKKRDCGGGDVVCCLPEPEEEPESEEEDEKDCLEVGGICTEERYCRRGNIGRRGRCEGEGSCRRTRSARASDSAARRRRRPFLAFAFPGALPDSTAASSSAVVASAAAGELPPRHPIPVPLPAASGTLFVTGSIVTSEACGRSGGMCTKKDNCDPEALMKEHVDKCGGGGDIVCCHGTPLDTPCEKIGLCKEECKGPRANLRGCKESEVCCVLV
ncbi:unnamed protein product [Darwinula stevensoni]|uniref:Uncharacterized protein n=1 Tax=Darwinula stevensoni TaxID=69355 RepID=A0A7R9A4J4_9CRUS|nr:unnamed protein product [Darwinula stevensoni]CAG0890170.1 unnamed protein product [Darwinula stevensoni]